MTKAVVTVGALEITEGSKDGKAWTRFGLLDNDKRFVGSTFDPKIAEVIRNNRGLTVTVDVKENGKFKDLVGIEPLTASAPAGPAPETPRETYVRAGRNDLLISRQVALKAAVELAAHSVVNYDDILAVADKYVSWIHEASQVEHIRSFDPDEVARRHGEVPV